VYVVDPVHVLRKKLLVVHHELLYYPSTEAEAGLCALVRDICERINPVRLPDIGLLPFFLTYLRSMSHDQSWKDSHYLIVITTLQGLKDEYILDAINDYLGRKGRALFVHVGPARERGKLVAHLNGSFGAFLMDLDDPYFDYDSESRIALRCLDIGEIESRSHHGLPEIPFLTHGSWLVEFLRTNRIPRLEVQAAIHSRGGKSTLSGFIRNLSQAPALNVRAIFRIDGKHAPVERSLELARVGYRRKAHFAYNLSEQSKLSACEPTIELIFNDTEGRLFRDSNDLKDLHSFLSSQQTMSLDFLERSSLVFDAEMQVRSVDLRNFALRNCQVGIVQFYVEQDSLSKRCKIKNEYVLSRTRRLLAKSGECLEKGCKIVVFPELAAPHESLPKLVEMARMNQAYAIAGLEYDDLRRNVAAIVAPSGRVFYQGKMSRSPYDSSVMKLDRRLTIFRNSGFGDFAVLVCYDLTNPNILHHLRGQVDFLFVLSHNKAIHTFVEAAKHVCYSNYCFVCLVNVANYGGSGIYYPRKGNRILAQQDHSVEDVLVAQLTVAELRRAIVESTFEELLQLPAGFPTERVTERSIRGSSIANGEFHE
jgi:predicted amidohydrolase